MTMIRQLEWGVEVIGESGWDNLVLETVFEESNFSNLFLKFGSSFCSFVIFSPIFSNIPECGPNFIHDGRERCD